MRLGGGVDKVAHGLDDVQHLCSMSLSWSNTPICTYTLVGILSESISLFLELEYNSYN